MAKKRQQKTAEHIRPLNMNGLNGRVLDLPAPKKSKQQILLVYGHHANIERMFGLAEELNRYGAVTLPDLPGFGGMDSFYRIAKTPTLDQMSDYLASFIKMRYKRRRITVVGMSFGFLVVTRMLQRYPDIAKKVDIVVSIAGFVHHEDFKMKTRNKLLLRTLARFFTFKPTALFARYVLLSRPMIYFAYWLAGDSNAKMRDIDLEERKKRLRFEVTLWQTNDVRTYCLTGLEMLRVNLFAKNQQLDVNVTHVKIPDDTYFDNHTVEQHMGVMFKNVTTLKTTLTGHAPTVVATAKEAAPFIPNQLRTTLKSL